MNINERLEELYNSKYSNALENKGELIMSNPLLIKVDEEKYNSSDIKVMIIGQETYGWWEGVFGDKTVQELMDQYDGYLHNKLENMRKKSSRAFWKGFKYFEDEIQKIHTDKNVYCIWNNIVKIGKDNKTGISDSIRDFERKYLSMVKKEIQILKPDIVIFLTGPNRDYDIKYNFDNVTFENQNKLFNDTKYREPALVVSEDLPKSSVRLYHPNYFGGFHKVKHLALKMIK